MNKKKLTLLIALSISIIIMVSTFIVDAIQNTGKKVEPQQAITSEEADPSPPSAEKESANETVEEPITLLSIEEVAKEVIAGKWGNGEERKALLTTAGYDFEAVQAQVDKLIPTKTSTPSISTPTKLPTGNYPEAQYIWDTMISWGWTPETCAGIIGNMMAEVGQGRRDDPYSWLSLDWDSDGGCGYGLIQWTGSRRSLIKSRYGSYPNIEQQLIFMRDELFGTNNTRQQVSSSVLNKIMNKSGNETPESIALCFASNYERCATQHRAKRQGYARIAYNYFMKK